MFHGKDGLTIIYIYMLLTPRTVVQQLVSCPKSVIIHVCIIGHKQYPQAFM